VESLELFVQSLSSPDEPISLPRASTLGFNLI
jgi:hypothetical protein